MKGVILNAEERKILFPITIGSTLEWYEFYLYIYWGPILSSFLYDIAFPAVEFIHATTIVLIGLCARPLGGVVFGYYGDKIGREKVFLISILGIVIPIILIFILSLTLKKWALFAIIWMTIGKFLQGIPAGGELPGALCYLSENSSIERKRYLCSYLLVGPQIGQILSMLQCFLLQSILPQRILLEWGWRISFLIAGLLGFLGFFLRKHLHESRAFHVLQNRHKTESHPIREIIRNFKGRVSLVFFISIFEVVGFYLLEFFIIQNAKQIFGTTVKTALIIYSIILIPITILMPIVGKIGCYINNKKLYLYSAFGIILLSIPFYFSILYMWKFFAVACFILLMGLFTVQFSLLPSLIADLFPTKIRYTGLGFSFNMADSVIGGLALIFATYLINKTGNPGAFVAIIPFSAIIFIVCLNFVSSDLLKVSLRKERKVK